MAILYLTCGCPGSGKSTWVQKHMNPKTDKWVSRDAIRFSLLGEKDDYFAKENLVYNTFIKTIDYYINQGFNVFADATHLNSASRSKLLKRISCKPEEINIIWVDTPLQIAIERNEERKGTRAYVPPEQIRRMFNSFERPLFYEGFKKIYVVKNNKPMEILVDN